MSGFIYVWLDRKHHRFYIGSHWGSEDDGYVCSSTWMKQAHLRRPDDFKRRIIARIHTLRSDLLMEELRWLRMIPAHELGKRYYNLRRAANFGGLFPKGRAGSNNPMHGRRHSRTSRLRMREAKKLLVGPRSPRFGRRHSPESREKMAARKRGRVWVNNMVSARMVPRDQLDAYLADDWVLGRLPRVTFR